MSYRLRRQPEAEQDIFAHTARIARDQPRAALRFVSAIEETCALLAEHPEMGTAYRTTHPELAGVRKWVFPGFRNYVLYYRVAGDVVDLLRLLRAERDAPRLLRKKRRR